MSEPTYLDDVSYRSGFEDGVAAERKRIGDLDVSLLSAANAAGRAEARASVEDAKRKATMGPSFDSTDVTVAWAIDQALAAIDALRKKP